MTGCAIIEIGMVSALGLDADNACAAARAGLSRLQPLDVKNFVEEERWDGESIYGHCVPTLGHGFVGPGKAKLLGEYGLRNLLAKSGMAGLDGSKTGLHLFLSDYSVIAEASRRDRAEEDAEDAASDEDTRRQWVRHGPEILQAVVQRSNLNVAPESCRVSHGDHAGIIKVIEDACDALRSGELDSCIVGAIDSKVEPGYLEAAADLLMLRTENYPAGFLPGEAAAFMLLQRMDTSTPARNAVPIVATEFTKEAESYLGEEHTDVFGTVNITTTNVIANIVLPPILKKLGSEYPNLIPEITVHEEFFDIYKREADIAIRSSDTVEPHVHAEKIGKGGWSLYAVKDYMKNKPGINSPDFYTENNFIMGSERIGRTKSTVWLASKVESSNVVMKANSMPCIYSGVKSGIGIGMLPSLYGKYDSSLVELSKPDPRFGSTIWLIANQDLVKNQKIEICMDFLGSELKKVFSF